MKDLISFLASLAAILILAALAARLGYKRSNPAGDDHA